MRRVFGASITANRPRELFDTVAAWPEFQSLPFHIGMGHDRVAPAEWRTIRDANNPTGGIALWDDFQKQLGIDGVRELVWFEISDGLERAAEALARITLLDFRAATLETVFPEWLTDGLHERWGFDGKHMPFGWGCLLRGSGHDRLVSRRWLDYGPWRVEYLSDDATFVQFHDLAVTDSVQAYEQAREGHRRMSVGDTGGYIASIDSDEFAELTGTFYYEDTRLLEILIAPKIEVPQRNMRIACALRLLDRQQNRQDGRVERVAYVFINRADAESHLHELWLRELECWYVDETGKHRLDDSYRPTPRPPAWVARLKDSSVNDVPMV